MQTTSILTGDIMGQASAFREARSQFGKQFRDWSIGIPPLEPEHFWPMAKKFLNVVISTMCYSKESAGEKAADEFMRLAAVNDGDIAAAVHFALSWRHYKGKVYEAGDKAGFSFCRGDDSYGDLMDALPLMGQEVNEGLAGFRSLNDFDQSVMDVCKEAVRHLSFAHHDDPVAA